MVPAVHSGIAERIDNGGRDCPLCEHAARRFKFVRKVNSMESYDGTWCPPPAQLQTAQGDPNSTAEHVDVIKESLKFKAESVIASDQDREQARALLKQLYPQEFRT